MEWEKQRRDQLVADKSREENLVDDLKQETGQQKLLFESLVSKFNYITSESWDLILIN